MTRGRHVAVVCVASAMFAKWPAAGGCAQVGNASSDRVGNESGFAALYKIGEANCVTGEVVKLR